MENNLIKGIAIMATCSLFASLSAAGTKYTSHYLSLHVIILIQYGIGLMFSVPLLMRSIKLMKKSGETGFTTRRWRMHLVRGLSGLGAIYCFYFVLTKIHLAEAVLLRNSAPLWIPVIIRVWLKMKIPRRRWLPLTVGFIGVICILRPLPGSISLWHLAGAGAAIFIGITMVSTRLLVYTESNITVLFYYYALVVPVALPLAVKTWQPAPLHAWGVAVVTGILLYLAMNLYTMGFRYAKPSVISPIAFFGVVFAGLWDWLFWNQTPVVWTYLGVSLVLAGTIIVLIQGTPDVVLSPEALGSGPLRE